MTENDMSAASPDDAAALLRQSKTPLDHIQHALHKYPVISPAMVLLLSGLVFTYLGDGRFQQPSTIGIMLQQTAVLATLAIGQTLIILTAGIDLSVGTAMLLTHTRHGQDRGRLGIPGFAAFMLGALLRHGTGIVPSGG